jgi:hypothetical protein
MPVTPSEFSAVRVYEVQHERLDQGYLSEWTSRLGLKREMERLREEARAD